MPETGAKEMSWMIYGYKWDKEEPVIKWSAKTNREVIGLMKTAVDNLGLDHIDIINVERFNKANESCQKQESK